MKQMVLFTLLLLCTLSAKEGQNRSRLTLHLGPDLYYFSYSEKFTDELFSALFGEQTPPMKGKPKSDEYGPTGAINGGLEIKGPLTISLNGSFGFSYGHTYDGSTQGVNSTGDTLLYEPYKFEDKANIFARGEASVGHAFSLPKKVTLTPQVGIRLNSWRRSLDRDIVSDGTSIDTITTFKVREIYKWRQLFTGIKLDKKITKRLSLQFAGTVDFQVKGSMAYINEEDEYLDSATTVTLGNHLGTTITMGITRHYGQKLALQFQPYYRYYHFGLSDQGTKYYINNFYNIPFHEPESKTHLFGIGFHLLFTPPQRKG